MIGPTGWTSGVAITYNIPNGFSVGSYIYTVNFTDDHGNSIIDDVTFTVGDATNPTITSAPTDFTVEFGYTGQSLSWTATDLYPNTYTIELQGTGIVAGPTAWMSGNSITYNIPDGFAVGVYVYTVNFTDDHGNFKSDTVIVTINSSSTPPPVGGSPFELIIIASVIGGGAVIGLAVALVIRRKRN